MAIIADDDAPIQPESPPPIEVTVITPEPIMEEIVDQAFIPAPELLVYMEGSSWVVNYYSQVLAAGSEPTPLDINATEIYQQYSKISGMELKVTSPLTQQQNETTGEFEVVGTATLYPGIAPNYGDMFFADVGDGRVGVFTVISLVRKTILKASCYEVNYQMLGYADDALLTRLDGQVIKNYEFDVSEVMHSQRTMLSSEEATLKKALRQHRRDMIDRYRREFYSSRQNALLVPSDTKLIYDPYVADAFTTIVSGEELIGKRNYSDYVVTGGDSRPTTTIWDIMLNVSDEMLKSSETSRFMRHVPVSNFSTTSIFASIMLSEINEAVWPENRLTYSEYAASGDPTASERAKVDAPSNPVAMDGIPHSTDPVVVYPPYLDSYYVFSKHFYEEAQRQHRSDVEAMVLDMLEGRIIDKSKLNDACIDAEDWDGITRYYMTPVLLILITMAIGRV